MWPEEKSDFYPKIPSDIVEKIICYPYYYSIVEPLLIFIYENGGDAHSVKTKDTYEPLADYFGLTEEERTRTYNDIYKNGKTAIYWKGLVQRAKDSVLLRYIMPGNRGVWSLTNQGVKLAQEAISKRENELYESISETGIREGSQKLILSNRYERSFIAREICIRKYGQSCSVCKINFSQKYGSIGDGYIHVHHKNPLSITSEEHIVNPETDMVPVCPNCHAMLHRRNPPFTVDELIKMIEDSPG